MLKNITYKPIGRISSNTPSMHPGPLNYIKSGFPISPSRSPKKVVEPTKKSKPEILFITSYPPRECGIATYSHDLIEALNNKFNESFTLNVCALESGAIAHQYKEEVHHIHDTSLAEHYTLLAKDINQNSAIELILFQHEFGLYNIPNEVFIEFINLLNKPIIMVFHTVLSKPNSEMVQHVKNIVDGSQSVVVMTNNAAEILTKEYDTPVDKITVIPHGTHLVPYLDKSELKQKYQLADKKILSTFGLLSSGKSIETTIEALPMILNKNADILFLVIGKTHPDVLKSEGEKYRELLKERIKELGIENHVQFINEYLPLPTLLEYLQLTDVYLFTSKNPAQAVSGTFAYAMGCGCAIISTPIPHVKEVLNQETGVIIDFQDSEQLAINAIRLLNDDNLRDSIRSNAIQKIVSTAWENAAVAHAMLFEKVAGSTIQLEYSLPTINLNHIHKLTTDYGMVQFSKINQPDLESGYTIDDNARALIATCMHFEATREKADLPLLRTYIDFITCCQQEDGSFLNYVDQDKIFTKQNNETNIEDSNGRTIWALGYFISLSSILPLDLLVKAKHLLENAYPMINRLKSPRSISFSIKGLYYYDKEVNSVYSVELIKKLGKVLSEWYDSISDNSWKWYESYLTYANSILPEAMLYASYYTKNPHHREIALESFKFLLAATFEKNQIKIISNQSWLQKNKTASPFGEQPIDVAYTIMTLGAFYDATNDVAYLEKMQVAFNWFLGSNHLHQIVYNPCTGGCYDGLEEHHINLNQGAESTVCYLMARMTIEHYYPSNLLVKTN